MSNSLTELSLKLIIFQKIIPPAVILGHHGFLKNKKATCYPGFEQYLKDAIYYPEKVITDGLISTARGLGASIDLGLEIIKLLFDEKKSIDIAKQIQYLI